METVGSATGGGVGAAVRGDDEVRGRAPRKPAPAQRAKSKRRTRGVMEEEVRQRESVSSLLTDVLAVVGCTIFL